MAGVLRYLDDITRAGMFVQVTCLGCGRQAIYSPGQLRNYLRSKDLPTDLRSLAQRMRCHDLGRGCGHRGARLAPVDWPPPLPPTAPPVAMVPNVGQLRDEKKAQGRH